MNIATRFQKSKPLSVVEFEHDIVVENEMLGDQPGGQFKSGFVGIVGNPNVGKSTLMNALIGESLSIVNCKAQTTRHRILGICTEKQKHQIIFTDTPGLLSKPAYQLHKYMMETASRALGDSDVIMYVTDVFESSKSEGNKFDEEIIAR